MGKTNFIKKLLPIVLALMMVVSSMPLSFADPVIEPIGSVEAIAPSQASFEDSVETIDGREVPVKAICFDSEFSLEWVEKNADGIQRPADGWWVGAKIIAPNLSLETLKTGKFYMRSSSGEWTEYSFADNRDSTDTDSSQFINVWSLLNESKLNQAVLNGKNVVTPLRFDWDGDNTIDQCINTVVVPSKVTLNKGGNTVYPTTGLAAVSALHTAPENLTITGTGTNYVTVRNNAYTLEWSKADASIGRPIDAWWVGVQITAPEGMSDAQLTAAKLSLKGSSGWQDGLSVLENLEHRNPDWFGLWLPVKESDTGEKSFPCRLDWNGDGVYEQMVDIVIDTDKLTLDKTNLYAEDKAAPVFTDMPEDATTYVGDDTVTLTGKVSDIGTVDGTTTYTSGIKNAFYAVGSKDAAKHALTFNENGEFSVAVSEEFEGYYYFFATDNAGNESAETKVLVKHDVAIPTLEEVSLSNENWTKDDITITGKALDSLSGVNKVGYVRITEDDGIFADIDSVDKLTEVEDIDSQNRFELTVPADDYEGKIAVFAFDNVGRRSEAKVFSVKMDKSGFYSASAEGNSEWSNESILIQGSFVATLSGLDKIEYKKNVDGSSFTEIPETDIKMATDHETDRCVGTYSFTIPQENYDGDYIIRFTDRAGNVKEINVAVHQDTVSPEINSLVVTPAGPTNGNVVISGTFTDNLSGVKEVWYTEKGSLIKLTDVTIDGNSFSAEIPKQDFYGFYDFYCVDNAQNESEATQAEVKMDITAPEKVQIQYSTPVFSILASKIFFFKENCQATLSTKDNLSNIESFSYSYAGSEQTTVNRDDSRFIPGSLQEGEKCVFDIPAQFRGSVVASAKDVAGNGTEDTVDENTLIVDNIPAVIDAQVLTEEKGTKGDVNYYQDDVKIKVLVDEANFMDGEFEDINDIVIKANIKNENDETIEKSYSVNNWSKNIDGIWEGEFTITDEGDYTIHIDYMDKSGNVALTKEVSNITIDKTAPVINISYDNNDVRNEKLFNQARKATIKVTEHNFFPEDIDWQCTAHDYADNDVNVEDYGALLKDIAKWTKEGNVYTIDLLFTEEAKYAYSFAYTDPATNVAAITYAAESKATNDFVIDKTVPGNVTITYEENPIDVILSALTFHFYKGNLKVKLSATDNLSDIYAFKYSYIGNDGIVSENIPDEKDKTVTKADEGFAEEGAVDATYTFSIPAQFRGYIKATAIDYALNEGTEVSHENSDIAVNDTKTPLIDIAYSEPSNPNKDGVDFYKDDVTVTLTVNEENFMDGEYPSIVRDMQISAEIIDDNGESSTETYTVNNWQRVGETDTWQGSFVLSTEGDYTLTINYQDKSENKADTIVRDHLTIDKTAPVINVKYQGTPSQTVTADGDTVTYYNANSKPGLVITVIEHNFNAEYVVSKIKATKASKENHIDEAEDFFANYLKSDSNWKHEGNTHTINVPLDNYEANYLVDFNVEDLARNNTDAIPEKVTYDTIPAGAELSINSKVIRKVLNSITFGIFNKSVPAEVTISATDEISAVESLEFYTTNVAESKNSIPHTKLDIKNPILNNKETTAGVNVDDSKTKVAYTFKVDPEFRNCIKADVVDYAKNTSSVDVINYKFEEDINIYDGIIKDEKPGTINITIPQNEEFASQDTFASDFNFYVNLADENAGIGNVAVTLNGYPIKYDADGNKIAEYYENDNLIRNINFNINTSQLKGNEDSDAIRHGKYTLKIVLTDNAGNESSFEKIGYIDVFAPKISHFDFETDGRAFVGNKEYKNRTIVDVVTPDTNQYNYYFENDTYVHVYAYDIDSGKAPFNERTCGIQDIELIATSNAGEEVIYKAIENSFVRTDGKVGYSVKTFKIEGPFKGNLYARATDYAGNAPSVKGLTDPKYQTSKLYKGFVNPNDSVIEDGTKHLATSSIEFTDKHTGIRKTEQAYSEYDFANSSFNKFKKTNLDNNHVTLDRTPLYSKDPVINVKVTDSYSGISKVEVHTAKKAKQSGKLTFALIDTLVTDDEQVKEMSGNTLEGSANKPWAIALEKNSNLVTTVSRNISYKDFGELDENDFTIIVVLTDRSGNQSYDYYTFGVDKTEPSIRVDWAPVNAVKNYNNQDYFSSGRVAKITIKDKNINEIKDIQKVKEALIADNNVTNNKFGISAFYRYCDNNWNWHDKDAMQQFVPEIPGVSVSPSYAVRSKSVDKDGNFIYTFIVNCKADGDYLLNFACKDNTGRKTIHKPLNENVHFTVDTTKPTVTYSINNTNAKNDKYFNSSRTATIVVKERNINVGDTTQCVLNNIVKTLKNNKSKVKIDWKPDKPNNTYTGTIHFDDDGDYVVDLKFTDFSNHTATVSKTGNTARVSGTAPLDFTIDKVKPELSFNVQNTSYKNNQNVIVTVIDDNNDSVTPEQESYTFNQGTGKFEKSTKVIPTHKAGDGERTKITYQFMTVKNDGYYIINAKAVDKAGNEASAKQVVFTKNEHGSIYVLSNKLQKIITSGYINSQQFSNLKKGELTITEYNPDKFGFDENDPSAVSVAFKNPSSIKKGGISHSAPSRDSQAGWWSCTYTIDNSIFEKYSDGKYFINYISDSKTEQQKGCQFVLDTKSPTLSLSAKEVNDAINPESIAKDGLRVFNDKLNLTLILRDEVGFQLNSKGKSDIAYYFVDEDGNRVGDMHFVEFESGADSIEIPVPISESDNIKNIVLIAKDAAGNTWTYKGLDDKLMEKCKNDNLQYVFSYERGVLVTKNIFRQISAWIQTNVFQTILIGLGIILVIAAAILIPIFVKRRKNEEDEPVTEEYGDEDDE